MENENYNGSQGFGNGFLKNPDLDNQQNQSAPGSYPQNAPAQPPVHAPYDPDATYVADAPPPAYEPQATPSTPMAPGANPGMNTYVPNPYAQPGDTYSQPSQPGYYPYPEGTQGTYPNPGLNTRCPHCGTSLLPDQVFCPNCGQRTDSAPLDVNPEIARFNDNINKKSKAKIIIPIVAGAVLTLLVVLFLALSSCSSPEDYMAEGKYYEAYEEADSAQKDDIVYENMLAVVCADCVDSLKDPDSFELEDAWVMVNDSAKVVFIKVSANNSFGNRVINYWHYSYDDDEGEYQLLTTFADFDEEKVYSWDDKDEKTEKILKNAIKESDYAYVSGERGVNLSEESINRINDLFEKDILDDVILMDVEPEKTE